MVDLSRAVNAPARLKLISNQPIFDRHAASKINEAHIEPSTLQQSISVGILLPSTEVVVAINDPEGRYLSFIRGYS